ncbi:hypothetical protein BpHYR1_006549 [Brachionus plicatilis]|uniref:Uncharacterized protein n=1 Tax=Brachionus plicatilis TaxID=10195 RepID=A0A3M7SZA8_BRAPC|nr:hypothetical protein BpHYR1_006549 [Brachionus plicatilis]
MCRVAKRKYHRSFIQLAHFSDHTLGEYASDTSRSDQRSGLYLLDSIGQIFGRSQTLLGVLVLGAVQLTLGPVLDQKTVHIEHVNAGTRLLKCYVSFATDGQGDQVGYAARRLSRSHKQNFVLFQRSTGVVGRKVLELYEAIVAEAGHHCVHELVHELFVHFTSDAFLSQTYVERVVEQLLVVGANVKHDGQAVSGIDAGERCVQGKLSDWYAHAVAAEVAQAQYALAICHHYGLDN